jgi:hypothetical protein
VLLLIRDYCIWLYWLACISEKPASPAQEGSAQKSTTDNAGECSSRPLDERDMGDSMA